MIPEAEWCLVLNEDKKRRCKQNRPKSLDLKKGKKSEVCILPKYLTQVGIAGIFWFPPTASKKMGTEANGPDPEQTLEEGEATGVTIVRKINEVKNTKDSNAVGPEDIDIGCILTSKCEEPANQHDDRARCLPV